MRSSLYFKVKGFVGLLSTDCLAIELIQAMLLVTFYEIGHGIYPAATVSVASCASAARAVVLQKKKFQEHGVRADQGIKTRAEVEKRAWWAVINLER